jgi:hypothetical protein
VKPTTKASRHKIIEIIDRKSGRKEMVIYTTRVTTWEV